MCVKTLPFNSAKPLIHREQLLNCSYNSYQSAGFASRKQKYENLITPPVNNHRVYRIGGRTGPGKPFLQISTTSWLFHFNHDIVQLIYGFMRFPGKAGCS